ncbi:CPBP family intramembrane glutamic endopeptidase [Cellulomonas sp. P24]|uniref:CPBP family intramembrane glutamic endopeptidase n=1 Tax=Cellulomonas sp. P24 TaxID=2885206 RepID=UPI00216B18B9|nr:CPBP family intramembrane glutamic endopeptidase [Cellulomonas sp. P24]MCR6491121.1 CPBP family intramembrane metalloprotease [Cellulomonas sp. P24]
MTTLAPHSPAPLLGRRHPVRTSLALTGASVGVTLVGALVVELVAPGSDPLLRRLPVVLALLAMALVVVRRIGWRRVGAGGPATWRRTSLLVAPAVVALVPLAWGWAPDLATLPALVVGYLATGLYEELWFRGVMLRSALPLGPVRAAALTAVLFGAAHLGNVAFGANAAVTAAQAVGAAAGGFGYAILRQRTGAVWALAAIHFGSDLLLHTTGLHGGALWAVLVGHDVALSVIGLLAVRGLRRTA